MEKSNQDIWAKWILQRRFGGDREVMKTALNDFLYPLRDKVLDNARLGDYETLLDVGSGDGLIAFGALDRVQTSRVVFSDISQDLLDHSRAIAQDLQVTDRCEFINASADDLSPILDSAVDVVTTRSVLIYETAKQKAFHEFYRVLRPGGRLSIFEPINSFGWPEPSHLFDGYDVTPIIEIVNKVKELYRSIQPPNVDPMVDFDERDLLRFAENAGFKQIHLELQVDIKPHDQIVSWKSFMRVARNPKIPTIEEAIGQVLTPEESDKFEAHLQPLVEGRQGTRRSAAVYLVAIKK